MSKTINQVFTYEFDEEDVIQLGKFYPVDITRVVITDYPISDYFETFSTPHSIAVIEKTNIVKEQKYHRVSKEYIAPQSVPCIRSRGTIGFGSSSHEPNDYDFIICADDFDIKISRSVCQSHVFNGETNMHIMIMKMTIQVQEPCRFNQQVHQTSNNWFSNLRQKLLVTKPLDITWSITPLSAMYNNVIDVKNFITPKSSIVEIKDEQLDILENEKKELESQVKSLTLDIAMIKSYLMSMHK